MTPRRATPVLTGEATLILCRLNTNYKVSVEKPRTAGCVDQQATRESRKRLRPRRLSETRQRIFNRPAVPLAAGVLAPASGGLPFAAHQVPMEVTDLYDARGAPLSWVEDIAFSPRDAILVVDRDIPRLDVGREMARDPAGRRHR